MKDAFTLIELLVVIAIIAILAAILYPVFAQAKAAAKGSQEISNVKQDGLAIIMYAGDSDDVLPFSMDSAWQKTWASITQPYAKSYGIYRSPFDTNTGFGQTWIDSSWAGITISLATNSLLKNWGSSNDASNPAVLRGLFAPTAQIVGDADAGAHWIDKAAQTTTAVTKPAETIMLGAKYNTDVLKAGGWGNMTAFCGSSFMAYKANNGTPPDGNWDWCAPTEIPNGRLAAATYPQGPTGAVSMGKANVGSFVYSDGHAKQLDPKKTDPDPENQPGDNMWDALR
ncbi:hypothetical protein BH11ARM2_BH11ARM2_31110 [soil metagenome]